MLKCSLLNLRCIHTLYFDIFCDPSYLTPLIHATYTGGCRLHKREVVSDVGPLGGGWEWSFPFPLAQHLRVIVSIWESVPSIEDPFFWKVASAPIWPRPNLQSLCMSKQKLFHFTIAQISRGKTARLLDPFWPAPYFGNRTLHFKLLSWLVCELGVEGLFSLGHARLLCQPNVKVSFVANNGPKHFYWWKLCVLRAFALKKDSWLVCANTFWPAFRCFE